jgi:UDP-N-acetylmuramoyl-tripeptide--D-alanyl-D-alanine ligase
MGRTVNAGRVDLGWTLGRITDRLAGRLVGDRTVAITSVSTDSRDLTAGALFVAIVGERFDGHDHASSAMAAGAVCVVVDATSGVTVTPRIEVDDTGQALLDLAAMRRDELSIPVVAITGSTGKTSTKDLVAGSIAGAWASPRSYNNEIGVPLTVLATPDDATALILEVGSRGPGHIRWLGPAVRPDVAVITNLGVVHLETFGSERGLADAKYEIVEMLGPDGTAVLPFGEERLDRGGSVRRITFGRDGADVAVSDIVVDAFGVPTFTITSGGASHAGRLQLAGEHQALNAAAAAAVAVALGLDVGGFLERMGSATGSAWRMDVHRGRFTVVNDAYNANPQSMASALRTVAAMQAGRKFAILGPMAELGPVCEASHRAVGELAAALGFTRIVVVGPDHGYVLGAGEVAVNATDLREAADTLLAVVEPGDVVLVKASRSAGLERLAFDLIEEAAP